MYTSPSLALFICMRIHIHRYTCVYTLHIPQIDELSPQKVPSASPSQDLGCMFRVEQSNRLVQNQVWGLGFKV